MHRLSFFVLIGILSISVSGCDFVGNQISRFTGGDDAEEVPDSGVPISENSPASVEGSGSNEETFPGPVVEGETETTTVTASIPSDLIKSVDAGERENQVNRSRVDPFASLPIPPPPKPEPQASQSPSGSPSAPSAAPAPSQPVPGGPGSPGSAGVPGAGFAPNTALPELPPIPQPDLALAVQVTGVSRIGNRLHAIISSAEGSSEYVREGQRIANGRVLVKRIEVNRGGDPVVILEQNGIEVAKFVGEDAVDDSGSATAAAVTTAPADVSNKT